MKARPSKDAYYLEIAREVSRRGTCLRRQYGAVIVKDDQIVSTGYAGAPRGVANCVDLGRCLRQEMNIPSGQRYELCRSVHAEMNAVIHASRSQTLGATLYLAGVEVADGLPTEHPEPCLLCRRVIINAGIEKVVVHPRDAQITTLDPQDWIEEENQAARMGLVAPIALEGEYGVPGRKQGGSS
ncbi:MAG: dCMP deaminase family protein [Desulfarculaceae bacterium]|nr:dCMP deaminase family protein [Desulfarculaceae bacterium]MCF8046539.1 dCMP deaminase family protein [Desulfarculaceae bacterium]MCF8096915.1 dCMP deaminase family protein [Desulfarculaceae bacterium]MCF8120894.1 dCMP deaminase family protein [Desulfarculaceae bacterium]